MINTNAERIIAELSHEILSTNRISDIFGSPNEFPTALIEKFSVETALKYWKEQLSYESANCVMNNIYSFWVGNDSFFKTYPFTAVAWECYEAFDAGEYHRKNDGRDVNPDEKYTRPLIEEFLRKIRLIA